MTFALGAAVELQRTSSGNIAISILRRRAAQAQRHNRPPQLGRAGDEAVPLVEGDAHLQPLLTHWAIVGSGPLPAPVIDVIEQQAGVLVTGHNKCLARNNKS